VFTAAGCGSRNAGETTSPKSTHITGSSEAGEGVSVTVVYDNNPFLEGLKTSWGFSCLIRGKEKVVLFDTGGDGDTLLYNMSCLGIDPAEIDAVVISHAHGDHTGGLTAMLGSNPDVEVYLPASFAESFKDSVRGYGAGLIEVSAATPICNGISSTGEMGREIKEQALVVKTEKGSLVITGCAHPGIVDMVRAARESVPGDILLVMGGFHLSGSSGGEIKSIVAEFQHLGVLHVGPCHCTGERAMQAFRNAYGGAFLRVGAGRQIDIRELE
jgi:7,8-dihydropterin-6-yl-methyl-4-(beta-D-ribofuranosyl)aminobenzene 5'-phosphate synthase